VTWVVVDNCWRSRISDIVLSFLSSPLFGGSVSASGSAFSGLRDNDSRVHGSRNDTPLSLGSEFRADGRPGSQLDTWLARHGDWLRQYSMVFPGIVGTAIIDVDSRELIVISHTSIPAFFSRPPIFGR
jgi:hypothetical protein